MNLYQKILAFHLEEIVAANDVVPVVHEGLCAGLTNGLVSSGVENAIKFVLKKINRKLQITAVIKIIHY